MKEFADGGKLLAELQKLLERCDVFQVLMPSAEMARLAFERARREIKVGQKQGAAGASVWRTVDRETRKQWAVLVVDDECKLRQRVPWGSRFGGEIVEVDEELRHALFMRHLNMLVDTDGPESNKLNRYGKRGGELLPDGTLQIRVPKG